MNQPFIEAYDFGKIQVAGTEYTQDIRILNGRVIPDWWRKDGHSLVPEDLPEVLETAPAVLIIGTGYYGRMVPHASFREAAEAKGIRLIEEPSGQAVDTFNRLFETEPSLAAGFHLTC